ncbi:hypothetical protein BD289DRAFT_153430 [Coniella lustricola]|uniref:Uncharacterized protein n=1 Tax=Coniella lustricola TaxID=2025994 RepID=A0A2T3AM92_9PEZI|nr:hypothetical protein BD289DRAFT_153430 [Coniella lustricola]
MERFVVTYVLTYIHIKIPPPPIVKSALLDPPTHSALSRLVHSLLLNVTSQASRAAGFWIATIVAARPRGRRRREMWRFQRLPACSCRRGSGIVSRQKNNNQKPNWVCYPHRSAGWFGWPDSSVSDFHSALASRLVFLHGGGTMLYQSGFWVLSRDVEN